jgi:serine-type D-Ala-D-Ala carboxypeptidase/endopeptidase
MLLGVSLAITAALACAQAAPDSDPLTRIHPIFRDFALDAHLPGVVWGVVVDGHVVHVGTFGVQDLESRRPVTADTLFRIASMTKAFTALTLLKLRDDGRVRLDAVAEQYVPQLRT